MPPKKKQKRKHGTESKPNGDAERAPLDRTTWPGWVEMESEPAFFNVMLSDMGVQGVKVQEVYGLDPEMLAILPQPVHALIFLFRYRDVDESGKGTECPSHVWFANQIPDFACATVALLNIVNNIKGLRMGEELHNFHEFTRDMDPLSRGDAIDNFEFVRQIHNSFGREIDFLNADRHWQQQINKLKKKQALAKARETREAKKDANKIAVDDFKTPLKEYDSPNGKPTSARSSSRTRKQAANMTNPPSNGSSPLSDPPDSDGDFHTPRRPRKIAPETASGRRRQQKCSEPPELDPEFEIPGRNKRPAGETNGERRRSTRQPKPRKKSLDTTPKETEDENTEGFHFIAYMPIQGHVWRMDGLDKFPQDMGAFTDTPGGDWMSIAQTALQTRMMLYEGADIEFNLMAVVHDPTFLQREELTRNMKALQTVDRKLDGVFDDWRAFDGAETSRDVLVKCSAPLCISAADVEGYTLCSTFAEKLESETDLLRLIEMRKEIIRDQAPLRGAVRDGMESSKGDEEKARHRRHDYGGFVRAWLGELAENGLLTGLIESIKQPVDDGLAL